MASPFDAYADTQTGNYIGYSKGSDSYSWAGNLAQGLGKVLTTTTGTVDELIKQRIDKEAREKIEPVRDAAINALETGQLGYGVPDEIKGGLGKAEQYKMAKEAGRLDESHYWNLLDAEARKLRAQHPGYKDYVDSRISALAGADPANAMVRTLYNEQQALANQRKTDAQKEREKWETKYIESGLAGDPTGATGRSLANMSTEEMKRDLSQLHSRKAKQDEREKDINLKTLENRNVTNDVEFASRQELMDTSNLMMTSAFKPFQDLISAWNVGKANDQGLKINPAELEKVRGTFAEFENAASASFDQTFSKQREGGKSYGVHLSKEQQANLKEQAMLPIKTIKDAIFNSDTGMIGAMANRIKATDEANVLKIYDVSKFAQAAGAAKMIFGPQWGNFASLSGELAREVGQGAKFLDIITNSAQPKSNITQDFGDARNIPEVKPVVYNSVIDRHTDNLRTADPKSDSFKASANYFFGPRNKDFYAVVDPDTGKLDMNFKDPYSLYQKMAGDPVIAQNMAKIKESDPKTYQNWSRYLLNNFDTLMTKAATDAQSVVTQNANYTIKWDEKALKLVTVPREGGGRPDAGGLMGFVQRPFNVLSSGVDAVVGTQATQAVTQINQVLSGLKAYYKAEGMDPNVEIPTKMNSLPNLNLKAGLEGNVFDKILGTFKQAEEANKETSDKGIAVPKRTDRVPESEAPKVMVKRDPKTGLPYARAFRQPDGTYKDEAGNVVDITK